MSVDDPVPIFLLRCVVNDEVLIEEEARREMERDLDEASGWVRGNGGDLQRTMYVGAGGAASTVVPWSDSMPDPLAELAAALGRLTYGQMMDFAMAVTKHENYTPAATADEFATQVHRWAVLALEAAEKAG